MMDLESLLETLHLARRRYETLTARIRHAFDGAVLDTEAKRHGIEARWDGRISEAVDQLWFVSPDRWVLKSERGPGDGMIVGRDGDRRIRNFSTDDIASWPSDRTRYLGGEQTYRQVLWEPNLIVPLLWLEPVREDEIAGRRCVVARALPRPSSTDYIIIAGAHQYELAVDVERGIVLRLRYLYDGAVGIEDEVLEIVFDAELPDELFHV
jgi:hypothetical protein